MQAVAGQIGTWIFGSISPVAEIGSYARAAGLAGRIADVGAKVGEIAYPTFVDYRARRDQERFARLFVDVTRFFLVVMGAGLSAPLLQGRAVLRGFGPRFEHGSTAMTISAIGYVLHLDNGLRHHALFAFGHPRWTMLTDVLRAITTLAVVVPLIHHSGGSGFAFAVATGITVSLIFRAIVLARTVFGKRSALTPVSLALRWLFGLGVSLWIGRGIAGPEQRAAKAVVGLGVALATYAIIAIGLRTLTINDLRRVLRRGR